MMEYVAFEMALSDLAAQFGFEMIFDGKFPGHFLSSDNGEILVKFAKMKAIAEITDALDVPIDVSFEYSSENEICDPFLRPEAQNAFYEVGDAYFDGKNEATIDYGKSFKYFSMAADLGN